MILSATHTPQSFRSQPRKRRGSRPGLVFCIIPIRWRSTTELLGRQAWSYPVRPQTPWSKESSMGPSTLMYGALLDYQTYSTPNPSVSPHLSASPFSVSQTHTHARTPHLSLFLHTGNWGLTRAVSGSMYTSTQKMKNSLIYTPNHYFQPDPSWAHQKHISHRTPTTDFFLDPLPISGKNKYERKYYFENKVKQKWLLLGSLTENREYSPYFHA